MSVSADLDSKPDVHCAQNRSICARHAVFMHGASPSPRALLAALFALAGRLMAGRLVLPVLPGVFIPPVFLQKFILPGVILNLPASISCSMSPCTGDSGELSDEDGAAEALMPSLAEASRPTVSIYGGSGSGSSAGTLAAPPSTAPARGASAPGSGSAGGGGDRSGSTSSGASANSSGGGANRGVGRPGGNRIVKERDGTFARPGPGDYAFTGSIKPVLRGHRPGKTHVRRRSQDGSDSSSGDSGGVDSSVGGNRGGSGGAGGKGTGVSSGKAAGAADVRGVPQATPGVGERAVPQAAAGGAKPAATAAPAAAGEVGPDQPAFVPAPGALVPLRQPGLPAEVAAAAANECTVESGDATASNGGTAAGDGQQHRQQQQQRRRQAARQAADGAKSSRDAPERQWADRFDAAAGGEARDVKLDPVQAVRRWQAAFFGADLDD